MFCSVFLDILIRGLYIWYGYYVEGTIIDDQPDFYENH